MFGLSPVTVGLLAVILAASALMSGLSGFGFSAIGALCLTLLPPKLGVPLLMSLSAANQVMSLRQLKADMKPIQQWWPDGPAPYLLGGLVGVPVGLAILKALPTTSLMLVFGGFLVLYSAYSLLKPVAPTSEDASQLPKEESRAIVQPYIFVLQILSIALLALERPQTFGPTYWELLAITVPVVLPCTLLGVRLYRSLSDVNFRRVTFLLLGVSGLGLLLKAVAASHLLSHVA